MMRHLPFVMDPATALKKFYGYSSFRPGQKEVIDAAMAGRDSVVLMPTGGGKSICYQIPALCMPGCAIVVSPLIALMNDQVMSLCANGIPAVAIHSNRDETENRRLMAEVAAGRIKILYVSPERLVENIDMIAEAADVSMIAIDEAHCISQWGHDFRPVYTSLKILKERFNDIPIMALTATADRLTRTDIASELSLVNPLRWTGSFDRPNISLTVIPDPGKRNRIRMIRDLSLKYPHGAGIVYCLSRKKTEEMCRSLADHGLQSVCYHAGMQPSEREAAQKAFVNGEAKIVCATIAFGMGIDKSNIRWVVHNNMPGNIESYYQEIGRAGRDGLPAEALMFHNYADYVMRRNFAKASGQSEINCEKLDFMQKYAEASVCRRRILLSYFSEETECNCHNCDNCRFPRSQIDGTVKAQKVLSAIIRTRSSEPESVIVDVLRASAKKEFFDKGYDKLPTYGVGRDLSASQWHQYILQMIQLGLIEVAFEENSHLRPTPLGMKVVKGLSGITLSEAQTWTSGKRGKKTLERIPEIDVTPEMRLLDDLMNLRRELASKENIPPHSVLGDAAIALLVERKPVSFEEMLQIDGIGEYKAVKFGKPFILAIRKHKGLPAALPSGTSQKESLILFNHGMQPDDIAALKNIKTATVYSHLISQKQQGEPIDLSRLISASQLKSVRDAFERAPDNPYPILDGLGIPSHIVRTALMIMNSTKNERPQ